MALHCITVELEGTDYELVVDCSQNEAHDIGQAIANSCTIERVEIAEVGDGAPLLYVWGPV